MSNATSPNVEEFRRSLEQLVQQAQQTAQLGLNVAREQVETFVRNPNINEQMDEVRRNLQSMAREMETKAQELVHLASTYIQPGSNPFTPGQTPRGNPPSTTVTAEPPNATESATAAGPGTTQEGSDHTETSHTPNGEAPRQ